jgi:hypothetical protein
MVGIPYALAEAGFGLGLLLLALVAWLTDYSLRLMVEAAHYSGTSSYQVCPMVPTYKICSAIRSKLYRFSASCLLALVAWLSDYSLRLMVQAAHLSGTSSYQVCLITSSFELALPSQTGFGLGLLLLVLVA